jgi:excinuclease UvrABC nuclease subunit
MDMEPTAFSTLPRKMPGGGIYLFSDGLQHLYVGRSRNLRSRLGRHCLPGATHRMAAFAFRLAREATGRLKASYTTKGSRADLMENPHFRAAFEAAKTRIQRMDVRFVAEGDPLRQTLLEIYAAVTLATPYNDFNTH